MIDAAATRAMVLGAGLGTRLRPLTLERPKPAVPVANRPLIAFTLEHWARSGGRFAAVNGHHLPDVLEEALRRAAPEGLRWALFREEALLGTGGGIRNARGALLGEGVEAVVVLNGDILFAPDLEAALATHRRLGAVATMVLRHDRDAARHGAVEIDGEGRVRRLLGRPEDVGAGLEALMFTGVHVLSPRAFDDLPAAGCIVRHSYRRWVDGGAVVAGHVDDSPWADLGTPAAYLEANLALARERGEGGNLVHPAAEVAPGAVLRGAVVGAGARVAADAVLERTVVWDGARASGPHRNAILTPHHEVTL